jgi:hypothetical protein
MPRAATALDSLRHHLTCAIEQLAAGGTSWIIIAEGAAFVAENMAAETRDRDRAAALRKIVGTCRGAAASPADSALALLREVAGRVAVMGARGA